ncbi:sensor domain-containing diguanylate cyclase [Peribacillus kribbensis]|uniref:sensor domain-containing diguanylate cyclase n=1 Tax=Peribacillus kribbensis TaxID=356658 RepID=UPI000418894B|nr:sensor domain-containing diguanylate cyclase [Peribacillus kribbensis]
MHNTNFFTESFSQNIIGDEQSGDIQASEQQMRILIDLIPELILLKDGIGRWILTNQLVLDLYGLGGRDYIGKTDMELADMSPQHKESFDYNVETDELAWERRTELKIEKNILGQDGVMKVWEVIKTPIFDKNGRRHRMVIVSRDVTERKKAEKALQLSEKKYRLIADHMNDLIAMIDKDGNMRYGSPSLERGLGRCGTFNIFKIVHAEDLPSVLKTLKRMISEQKNEAKAELRFRHMDGRYIWFEISFSCVQEVDGVMNHFIMAARDISERKCYEHHLEFLAYHDPLTGTHNRRWFMEKIPHEITVAKRNKTQMAFMYLDVDNFKQINDSWGHEVGDEILIQLIERIKTALRAVDTITRMGGDEFVIVIPDLKSQEEAFTVANQLCTLLQQPWLVKDQEILTTSSIGVAMYPNHGKTLQLLLKHADQALYRAKTKGRNQVHFFNNNLNIETCY